MRDKLSSRSLTRRDALRMTLYASAATSWHLPLWLSACDDGANGVGGLGDALLGGAGAGPALPRDAAPTAPYDPNVSWYMQNEYAPTQQESEIHSDQLEVVGAIPPELDGIYFRNGPNPRSQDLGHKFCGHGMVHAVALSGGTPLWYRNRYVRTAFYDHPDEITADPNCALVNTSVIYHASRLLAVSEAGLPFQISPNDLSTIGACDFAGKLADSFTGHPKLDPATGELLAYGSSFAPPFLRYYRIDAAGNMVSNEAITPPLRRDGLGSKLVMMHDFAITPTKTVFMHLPVVFDVGRLLAGSYVPNGWDESNGTHLGVMPRAGHSADVVWIEIDPCWIFHVVNAYDEGPNHVVLDVVRHDAPFWDKDNTGLLPGPARLCRYNIDLRTRSAKLTFLDDRTIEFPRIDDRLTARPHRYAYSLGFDETKMFEGHVTGLVKYDLKLGSVTKYTPPAGMHLDEASFVPAGKGEDEGYLIAFAFERQTNKSSLLILDATDVAGPPIAQIKLPVRVPIGLHSYWLPNQVG